MQITGNNRAWLAETGSHMTAHTTIQSPPNRRNCPCSERGRSSRDFRRHYSVLSVSGETSGLTGLLQAPVSAFKDSVPGGAIPPANTLGVRGNIGVLGSGRKRHAVTYPGFSPRASNCWRHSAGALRSRSQQQRSLEIDFGEIFWVVRF